jgi:hypothetical protein
MCVDAWVIPRMECCVSQVVSIQSVQVVSIQSVQVVSRGQPSGAQVAWFVPRGDGWRAGGSGNKQTAHYRPAAHIAVQLIVQSCVWHAMASVHLTDAMHAVVETI